VAVSIASAFVLACSTDVAEGTKTDAPSSSTATISGWVGDFSGWGTITNRPSLAGARVCADLNKTSQCVATDAAGEFHIEGAPVDSTVEVTVTANGFLNASESIHTSKTFAYGEAHLIPTGSVPPDATGDTGMLLVRMINVADIRRISGVAAGTIGGVEPLYTNEEGRFDATFAETGADGLALYVGLPPGPIAISAPQITLSDCGFSSDGWVTSTITANVVAGTVRTLNVFCGPLVAETLE
jgi:hypothetical protein